MLTHQTHPKCCSRMGMITLILAVAALALGGFATYKASRSDLAPRRDARIAKNTAAIKHIAVPGSVNKVRACGKA